MKIGSRKRRVHGRRLESRSNGTADRRPRSPAGARLNRRHPMQDIRGEGDQGSSSSFRDIGATAGLHHQIAALILCGIGQLQAERDLARLLVILVMIDVPVVMPALCAVIDGVLKGFDYAEKIVVLEFGIELQHRRLDPLMEPRRFGIALHPGDPCDAHMLVIVVAAGDRRPHRHQPVADGFDRVQLAGCEQIASHRQRSRDFLRPGFEKGHR